MNYQRIYNDFIDDRRAREAAIVASGAYTERHHIVPRSMGGGNEASNLIKLTAEDHIRAHLLLAKIHGGNMWAPVIVIASRRGRRIPTRKMIRIAALACAASARETLMWNKAACIKSARKFSSRREWHQAEGSAYVAAKKYGYFDECVSHMAKSLVPSQNATRTKLTDEEIFFSAKACTTSKEWKSLHPAECSAATKRGIYKIATAHFVRSPNPFKGKGKPVVCVCTGERFESRFAAAAAYNVRADELVSYNWSLENMRWV